MIIKNDSRKPSWQNLRGKSAHAASMITRYILPYIRTYIHSNVFLKQCLNIRCFKHFLKSKTLTLILEEGRGSIALLESKATSLGTPRRSRRAWTKSLNQNFEHGVYRPQSV